MTMTNCLSRITYLIALSLAFTSEIAAAEKLNVNGIRLSNGTQPYSGRVEININGVWGTVCDDSFDMNDAKVMCRMMNLNATTFEARAFYGPGIGPIFALQFKCNGYEPQLKDCDFVPNVQCTHDRDISIFCTKCGELDISDGNIRSISDDGKNIVIQCKEGFESNVTTSTCENGIWSVPSIHCTADIQNIRLVNGIGLYDGRVEILKNGSWGTICGTSFSWREVIAICNILFGTTSYITYTSTSNNYGPGTGPIHIDDLDCNGYETSLEDCQYSQDVSCTDHSRDVAVACNTWPDELVTGTRLVNGTGPYDGRMELNISGHWGTIDRRYIDMYDARTLCNTHNASLAMYYTFARHGQGAGPVLLHSLDCSSERNHISSCYGYSPYRPSSSHLYDLSIVCTTCGLPPIYNGEPSSFNGSELTITCQKGYQPEQVTMKCLDDNSWFQKQRCTPTFAYPPAIEAITLRNGFLPTDGRIEIKINGTWGTVCDTGFDYTDARVICNMFGLQYRQHYLKASHRSGRGYGPIFVSNMTCIGTEAHINNCSYDISNDCTHYDDVAVECTGYHLNITDVRLAGTNGPYHGRVEIKVNDTWGTICHNSFGSSEARFICRLLGLAYRSYFYNAYYGQGNGPIYIDRLDCFSSYTNFNQCRYSVDNYCSHARDVSVMCYGPTLNITDARLVNGTSLKDGRAEIKVDDTWGTICDENFDILAADVFCRLLGLRAAQYFTGAYYGEGTGPVFIDQLFCDDYDQTLSQCQYLFLNECSHARDVSVVCNECGQPDIFFWGVDFFTYNDTSLFADCSYYKTYVGKLKLTCDNQTQEWITEGECQEYTFPLDITGIRLVHGPNSTAGRVEIKSLDTWGTLCHDAFGIEEANVICRMLGYPPAIGFLPGAYFGAGKGPIFIDDLQCQDDAEHLNNCTYETYDNCNHDDDIAVVCTDCGDPKPSNGFVNSTKTNFGALVHVSCDKDYMLDGHSDITCQINGEWTDNPNCKLIDCGDPTPDNGNINTTSTTNGTIALVSCDNGYTLRGHDVITCQSNETWTQNPACDIIDCGAPKTNYADVTLINNKTTFGESAIITCWTGYKPKVNSNVMCLANGSWEQWTNCEIVDCGDPVPDKGFANSTTTTFNTVLEISCEPGYNLTGEPVIKCQEDETWTDYPVCDTSDCGQFSVVNGEVNTSLGTNTGSVATVKCDEGYDLQGSPEILCTSTGWNVTVSCQIQVCDDPSPTNGYISDTDSGDEFVFGNYVKIECKTGFDLEGDSVLTCNDGGFWSDSPTCRLIVCEKRSAPLHGYIDDSAGNEYNSEVIFSCMDGYLLVGERKSTCGDNDEWSSESPVCKIKSDVGGPCLSKEYCLMANSLCINSVCNCLTGIYDKRSKTCDKMPLLPYGIEEGDQFISSSDVCGPDISFPPGMPVSGKMRKHLFVCSYGFVSFDTKYTYPTPPEDINSIVTIGDQTIIAPFYGPINKRTSGPVYFRSYDILNSYDKMKDDDELISYIENIVIKFGDKESYDASFVMIATWHEARTTVTGFDSNKKSTFQAVLVSDGKSTYVFYIYGHGLMNWEQNNSELVSNVPVWVGYNVQNVDSISSFTHPYAFTSQALHLDTQPEVSSTEDDVAGLVFKPLHQINIEHKNDAVDCINWYNDNYGNKKNLDYIASLMPECPCDIWLSRFDPWFWRIGLQRWRRDVNYICVDMLHAGNFRQYGKSCCYDVKTWLWVYERPYVVGFQLYHPRYPLEHILNDVIYKSKCCVSSNYCNLFYELRPTGSCYISSPYDFGTFWGDPHFITLDRKNFTFNGLGEYTLLHIATDNFTLHLQARTERALKQDGNLSDATVFSAFAVRESSNAFLHVELNKAKTGMHIYANKADITSQFYADTDPEKPFVYIPEESSGGTLIISKRDETLSVLFPTSGISLNISVSVEMLSLNTGVPKVLQGLTTGLLGNYDGDPDNDFTMPNGTVLQGNLTEREIFEYGRTWAINETESAFVYEEGKSHLDYHNDSYVPRFLDEADPEKVLEAEKACNGSQNIECIFDLVFTEKIEIADQTSIIKGESDSTSAELEIVVPTLHGCGVVYASKGQTVSCHIEYDSRDEVVFLENNVDAKVDITSSNITYVQKTDEPVKIRIATKNKNGRSSPSFVLGIVLCTLCNGNGICSNETRESETGEGNFKYAKCICEAQYQGDDCEHDFDGCATNPCSLQRNCTSLTAHEQKLQNRSYVCGPCPSGFEADDDGNCIDIDECAEIEHDCDQVCTNKEGSFECSCWSGYKVDSAHKGKCKDINECDLALHNCTHECVNNDGGFSCQCYSGFIFDVSTWTCKEDIDAGSCNDSEKEMCSGTNGCSRIDGIPKCFCTDGFELDDTQAECKDIDECIRGICPQDCVNTNGSFQCVCFPGYKLQDSTSCKACEVPNWGDNCSQKCVCTGRGADRCDPVKGCVCKAGWQGEKCDDDIDECSAIVDPCDDPLKTCVNSLGSYTCSCRSGYQLTDQEKCKDIDECSDPQLNSCMHECTNTVGSYSCKCREGFTRFNETSCKDVDECTLGLDKCEQRCSNNQGFYSCFCYFGYSLNDDRQTCDKLSDPCFSIKNLTCAHFCVMSYEDATCGCMKGFILDPDNETCSDINECENNADNQCNDNAECINTAGSYNCECPIGAQLENDGRTCSDCDDYHYGKDCLHECSCLNGYCDKMKGCICQRGWVGENCDVDINECETGQLSCLAQNTMCVNLLGGALCSCEIGYENITGKCIDIDECFNPQLNTCDQQCINTNGSFTCSCYQGFQLKDGKCIDIDECSLRHGCEQICENTVGSYTCSCDEGFKLQLSDRKSCRPETECNKEENQTCPTHASCYVNNGNINCTCTKGFQANGDICEDVDECLLSNQPCDQLCNNTDGSFVCSCETGYQLQDDKVTCKECEKWKYGVDCQSYCSCEESNTEHCETSTGNCVCKPGWYGPSCMDDVDECSNTTICPTTSACENSEGSYICVCYTGYIKTGAKRCEECDSRHYGEDCLQECSCDIDNTEDCDHKTGSCICKQGWQGSNCENDVDECTNNSSICDSKAYSDCHNIDGSYECLCRDGFVEETGICTDIDECLDVQVNGCEQKCVNTPGTYKCACNSGFHMSDEVCKDVDECENDKTCDHNCNNTYGSFICTCDSGFYLNTTDIISCVACEKWTYGIECTNNCSCNVPNTKICDSQTGDCICYKGWNGSDCTKDIDECIDGEICQENSYCKNSYGQYDCICDTGYELINENICKECENRYYGENCSKECECSPEATLECNHVNGSCTCKQGWTGVLCDVDVDECKENKTICEHKNNSYCKNVNGSYQCVCDDGLRDEDNICTDCEIWRFGSNCDSECQCDTTNTEYCNPISGICKCKPGWNGTVCTDDVNECETDNICQSNSICNNTVGSYNCDCNIGFTETDKGLCSECNGWYFGYNCSTECMCDQDNTDKCDHISGECTCLKEWAGENCTMDVDECKRNKNLCDVKPNSTCNNTIGSYKCVCNTGFKDAGNNICEECTGWYFGNECSSECTCDKDNTEICDHITGDCTCLKGWAGENCTIDVNECSNNISLCDGKPNSTCNNTIGSFTCVCNSGFKDVGSNKCEECTDWYFGHNCSTDCSCYKDNTEICDHVTGDCTCSKEWEGDNCDIDVDECSNNKNICDTKANSYCNNTAGSYQCLCNVGFKDDGNNKCEVCNSWYFGHNCISACSCKKDNTERCEHVTGECTCLKEWTGENCSKDVDECTNNKSLCHEKANSTCKNTIGSFECECNKGFHDSGNKKCKECDNWYFGNNCSMECTCNKANADTCDHVSGECKCLKGWKGKNCTTDIDECLNKDVCVDKTNSTCNNSIGSYKCVCNPGFKDDGNNKCEECSVNTFGQNCSEICGCNITNALNEKQSCDIITGQCNCKAGWHGDSCNDDVNECDNSTSCSAFSDTTCVNTIGSFLCDCLRGLNKSKDGTCIEVSQTTTKLPGSSFKHSLILEFDLPADTNLQAATTYIALENEIISTLMDFYMKYIFGVIQIIINDIRNGSVIVDYTVVYQETSEDDAANLTKAVLDLEYGTQLTLYGKVVNATSTMYSGLTPCELYNATVGSCKQGYRCTVENNVPVCRQEYDDNEVNWSLVIGLTGAVLFTVIMVAIITVFLRRQSRQRKLKKREMRRLARAAYYHDIYRYGSDVDKVHRWQEGLASDTLPVWKPRNWRDLFTGPSMFRHSEDEPSYNQPYHAPRVRPNINDNNGNYF